MILSHPNADTSLLENISRTAARQGFLQRPLLLRLRIKGWDLQHKGGTKQDGENSTYSIETSLLPRTAAIPFSVVTTPFSSRVWISYFKGSLVEYDPVRDRHCVVYSPAWFYNWVKCMVFDGTSMVRTPLPRSDLISYDPIGPGSTACTYCTARGRCRDTGLVDCEKWNSGTERLT